MMVIEIASGLLYGSMALLADGLHMASHATALAINAFAYVYARRQARNPKFSFGTGKVNALGGFSGAMLLAVFAFLMAVESLGRQGPGMIRNKIEPSIEDDGDSRVSDLHLWSIGPGIYAAIILVTAREPATPGEYKERLPHNLGLAMFPSKSMRNKWNEIGITWGKAW